MRNILVTSVSALVMSTAPAALAQDAKPAPVKEATVAPKTLVATAYKLGKVAELKASFDKIKAAAAKAGKTGGVTHKTFRQAAVLLRAADRALKENKTDVAKSLANGASAALTNAGANYGGLAATAGDIGRFVGLAASEVHGDDHSPMPDGAWAASLERE